MCKCTPNIRTPFCGRAGCEWPVQITEPADILLNALHGIASDGTDHPQVEMHRNIALRAIERYRAYKAAKVAQFPRELPPGAVLVDSAECRVLTVTGPDTVPAEPMQKRAPLNCGPQLVRPVRVEDLPACGP